MAPNINAVPSPAPAIDERDAKIAALEAQIKALKAATATKMTMRVGEKGGVSVYGFGRNPVTLYREQWERLLAFVGAADQNPLAQFIEANAHLLKTRE